MTAEPEDEMSESALPVPSKPTRRKARQAHAIALLIAGHTQVEVAQAVGIDERTLRRWLAGDPEFRTQLNAAVVSMRDELMTRTVTRLAPRALDVLERGVKAHHEPENFRDQLQTVKEINRVVFPQTQGAQAKAVAQAAVIVVPEPGSAEDRQIEARRRVIEAQVLGDKYEEDS